MREGLVRSENARTSASAAQVALGGIAMTAKRLIGKRVNGGRVIGRQVNGGGTATGYGTCAHDLNGSNRFYPDSVPSFPFEPTRDAFAIRPISEDCGEGVVALIPFSAGETVFSFTGFYTGEITLFTLQVKPGLYLHDPFFMGKILHRCDPNCDVDMEKRIFTARRDIVPGEWVTMNYEQTEDRLFRPFTCNCGDMPCAGFTPRRIIRGRAVGAVPEPMVKRVRKRAKPRLRINA